MVTLKEILEDPFFPKEERWQTHFSYEHLACMFYCEALCFLLGHHPEGKIAHWEDAQYKMSDGLFKELICNDESDIDVFIKNFVLSNVIGEGTPMYIDNIEDPNLW